MNKILNPITACACAGIPVLETLFYLDRRYIFFDFEFLFVIAIACILLIISCKKSTIVVNSICAIGLIGFSIIIAIHLLFSIPVEERVVFKWVGALLLIPLWQQATATESGRFSLQLVLVGSLATLSCWGLYQSWENSWGYGTAITGPFSNSGTLSNVLLVLWPYTIVSAWKNDYILDKKLQSFFAAFYIIGACLGTTAVLLTTARAAWLGMIVSLFYVCAAFTGPGGKSNKKHLGITLAIIIITIITFTFKFKENSALGRLHIFEISFSIIRKSFPVGIGLGQIYSQFNNYQAVFFETTQTSLKQQLIAYNTFEAFNSLLTITAEAGVAGLITYAIIIYLIIRNSFKILNQAASSLTIGAAASVIGILVSSWISNPLHYWPIIYIVCAGVALLPVPGIVVELSSKRKGPLCLLAVSALSWVLWNEIIFFKASQNWSKAAAYAQSDNFEQARPFYEAAYPTLRRQGKFLYNYGCELSIAGYDTKAIYVLTNCTQFYNSAQLYTYLGRAFEKLHRYEKAAINYEKATFIYPSYIMPKYLLFSMYYNGKNTRPARAIGSALLAYPVKIQSAEADAMRQETRTKMQILEIRL